MRSQPLARIITVAAALTLLSSSAVSAQIDTSFPERLGETLVSAVVTNALDDPLINDTVVQTTNSYHQEMGGKGGQPAEPKGRKKRAQETPRGGFITLADRHDTAQVTNAVKVLARDTDMKPDLIVISGGDGQADVALAGTAADDSVIIDLSQPRPCVTENGQADLSGECAGSASAVPFNYTAVEFAVEDGAYLAGVLAAKASRGGRIGVISGDEGCRECERYVQGFVNGVRRVNPDLDVVVDYIASDEVNAYGDPETARTFTEIFIDVYQPAVLMPVGRAVNEAMIEAACDAGVLAVGTGREIRETRSDLTCVMASVIKDVPRAIREALYLYSRGETERVLHYDVKNGGVGISEDWAERVRWYPVDTEEIFGEALADITSGRREACPDGCGGSLPEPRTVTDSGE